MNSSFFSGFGPWFIYVFASFFRHLSLSHLCSFDITAMNNKEVGWSASPWSVLVNFGTPKSPFQVSSVSFPIFLWLIHLPLISEFRVKQERIAELSSLCSSMAISTLYQFFVLPRQRRLFLLLSIAFNFLNTFLIGAVLYNSSDQILSREWESPILMVLPLFIYQGLVILVGIICDSNSASSRQMIAQKLTEAVHRRNELDGLKSRQVANSMLENGKIIFI